MGVVIISSLSRRAVLLGAALATAGCASAKPAHVEPKRVLFVCRYGSVKSAIAREQFRRLAKNSGIPVHVSSRGISPEDHISPALLTALETEGLNVRNEPLQTLSPADLARADIVVVFDALPADLGAWQVRDWSDIPSMNADYAAARAALLQRLEALLTEVDRK